MSQADYPIEFVLESLESIMPPPKQPKVLLFDIGGVCVVSPMKGILDYEISQNIPPGWVNYSISKSGPNGFWHRLERGEILMDSDFFAGFNDDLRSSQRWPDFYRNYASKAGVEVTNIPPVPQVDGEYLFNLMMTLGREPDPWMFPALKKLRASGKYLIAALSNTTIPLEGSPLARPYPPDKDVRAIFEVFVSSAHCGMRKPHADIYAHALSEINKYAKEHAGDRGKGLGWEGGIKPDEIMFLDDIGENLKAGRKAGFGTIKVNLGMAYEAVAELEKLTDLQLDGGHPKVSSAPKIPRPKL